MSAYDIVESRFQNMARPRIVARVAIDPGDAKSTGAAIANAIRDLLKENEQALVVSVFAYDKGESAKGIFTRGVGEASRDKRGWAGDGRHSGPPLTGEKDNGQILVLVGNAFADDKTFMWFDR